MKTLDLSKSALVVIDLQKGIADPSRHLEPNSVSDVISKTSEIANLFRSKNLPVFLVHVSFIDGKDMLSPYVETPPWSGSRNSDFSEFVTGLKQPTDIEITKRQWSAFYGTELDLQLRRRGIKTIFLCGISTNIGVESTAREAFQLGYDQVFVTDSMTAFSKEEHEGTLKFIFPRIGVLRTTDQAISMIGSKQS